jgi:hypothetical protein
VWPDGTPPYLTVVIDTEEEFDWSAPFDRRATSVTAMRHITRVQSVFDRYGIRPTYVVDYPVASQPAGYEPLREILADGRCEIGAHMHPWVTPPFEEPLGTYTSYTCNLEPSVQRRKLQVLCDCLAETFAGELAVYKAGRYGIGASTVPALQALGFTVDTSVMPHMDFSADGGPSFARFGPSPFWFGTSGASSLFEVPGTCAYVGVAHRQGRVLDALASRAAGRRLRLAGILSRAGLMNKIGLSPEGNSGAEMRALTEALRQRDVCTFNLTFHSTSVDPGHTSYVRTWSELEQFLARLDTYFDFFFGTMGGRTVTLTELRSLALNATGVTALDS